MVQTSRWAGERLVEWDTPQCKPRLRDISNNFLWLKGTVTFSPDKVPSTFWMADCFMALHQRMECKLLKDSPDCSSSLRALREAQKLKSLHSALRHLYRGAGHSHDDKVDFLKSLMTPAQESPRDSPPSGASSSGLVCSAPPSPALSAVSLPPPVLADIAPAPGPAAAPRALAIGAAMGGHLTR